MVCLGISTGAAGGFKDVHLVESRAAHLMGFGRPVPIKHTEGMAVDYITVINVCEPSAYSAGTE